MQILQAARDEYDGRFEAGVCPSGRGCRHGDGLDVGRGGGRGRARVARDVRGQHHEDVTDGEAGSVHQLRMEHATPQPGRC